MTIVWRFLCCPIAPRRSRLHVHIEPTQSAVRGARVRPGHRDSAPAPRTPTGADHQCALALSEPTVTSSVRSALRDRLSKESTWGPPLPSRRRPRSSRAGGWDHRPSRLVPHHQVPHLTAEIELRLHRTSPFSLASPAGSCRGTGERSPATGRPAARRRQSRPGPDQPAAAPHPLFQTPVAQAITAAAAGPTSSTSSSWL